MEAASGSSCDVSGQRSAALVSGQSGYLSGVWAAETGCGTVDSPWQVRVRRGQHINVTLFDFHTPPPSNNDNRTSPAAQCNAAVVSRAIYCVQLFYDPGGAIAVIQYT